jgi:hypothetical protein
MMIHEGLCGQRVEDVVADAITLAKRHNCKVLLSFNGSKLKINKRLSVKHVLRTHEAMSEASMRRWHRSDECKKMVADTEEEKAFMQFEVDMCVANLPTKENLLTWLLRYCPNGDRIGVDTRADKVITHFEGMGYVANDCVGLGGVYDRDQADRYLVGQMIAMLKHTGHIHQVLGYHIEKELWRRANPAESKEST